MFNSFLELQRQKEMKSIERCNFYNFKDLNLQHNDFSFDTLFSPQVKLHHFHHASTENLHKLHDVIVFVELFHQRDHSKDKNVTVNESTAADQIQQNFPLFGNRRSVNAIGFIVFQQVLAECESVEICQHKNHNESQKPIRVLSHFYVNFLQNFVLTDNFEVFVELEQKLRTRFGFAVVQAVWFKLEK